MATIRAERPEDSSAIHLVNEKAFGQPGEAGLVDKLRKNCPDFISLVATKKGHVVGHILFTPATIETGGQALSGMGLAPMAVLPVHQRQGIGSQLVRHGLQILRRRSCPFVIVLGHPNFYPRFGFGPASRHGLTCQWEGIPDEAFMALILDQTAMAGVRGEARYRHEFDELV